MNKSILEEALEGYGHINAIVQNKKSHLTWEEEIHHLANITRALQQVKKKEKLLELYEKLAYYRSRIIHKLLDEIACLTDSETTKEEDIKYILDEAKNYAYEDKRIVEEIKKIKELDK